MEWIGFARQRNKIRCVNQFWLVFSSALADYLTVDLFRFCFLLFMAWMVGFVVGAPGACCVCLIGGHVYLANLQIRLLAIDLGRMTLIGLFWPSY